MKNIIFLALVGILGCRQQGIQTDKITVVVSILPLAEFVEKIGAEKVSVSVMIPPGASPHSYEPTPAQLAEVSRAKMYVKVGTPIEFELVWLNKLLAMNKNMSVVDASADIELLITKDHREHDTNRHGNQGHDPHIWLSIKNSRIMVNNIYRGLVSIDPDNESFYKTNTTNYLNQMDSLDANIKTTLAEKTNKKFMVYHPAWSYFAKDYNLVQIPVEAEGKEPTAKGIQNLIQQANRYDIKVIFASPQFNTKSAEVIARETKGRVVLINSLEKDYLSNMTKVAQALAEALE